MTASPVPAVAPALGAAPEPLLRPRMPELDSLRGLAALSVVAYHELFQACRAVPLGPAARMLVSATRAGWTGVDFFFVLSGFLITGLLLDRRGEPGYYRRFYVRRALRILPAYYATLGLVWICGLGSGAFVALGLVYLANVAPVFGVWMAYGPLWTISVEEHFYLLWPAVVRRLTPGRLAILAAAIVAIEPFARLAGFPFGAVPVQRYSWFVADGLAGGALVAVALRTRWASRGRVLGAASGLVAAGLALAAAFRGEGIADRARPLGAAFEHTLLTAIFAGALGLALLAGTGPLRGLVRGRVLAFYGRISYGLYLLHPFPFLAYDAWVHWDRLAPHATAADLAVRFAAGFAAATLLAALSRRFLEEPFLRLGQRLPAVSPAAPPVPG